MLGLIATRSIDTPVPGINELVDQRASSASATGSIAYRALQKIKTDPDDEALRTTFEAHVGNLGYALLLKRYPARYRERDAGRRSTRRRDSTIPDVPVLFWSFRFMVGLGFWFIALFAVAFFFSAQMPARPLSLVPVGALAEPAAAVDRRRTGLDRRRVWAPALGHRRRAADGPGRVVGRRRAMCGSA